MDSTKRTEQKNSRTGDQIAGVAALSVNDPAITEFAVSDDTPVVEAGNIGSDDVRSDHQSAATPGGQPVEDPTPANSALPEYAGTALASSESPQILVQAGRETQGDAFKVALLGEKTSPEDQLKILVEDPAKDNDGVQDLLGGQVASGPILSIGPGNLDDLLGYLHENGNQWASNGNNGTNDFVHLTVAFPDQYSQVPGYFQDNLDFTYQNLFGQNLNSFTTLGQDQIDTALDALNAWEDVANVIFTVVQPGETADIYIVGQDFDAQGLPGSAFSTGVDEDHGSLISINTQHLAWSDTGVAGQAKETILHEIAHSLGFEHPGNYDASDDADPTYLGDAPYIQDTEQYSVLSYFSGEWTSADYAGNQQSADTPQLHDHYVAQSVYGANWNARAYDSTYGYNSSVVSSAYDFTINTTPILTIWDGGGIDTLDLSGDASGVTLDLAPGSFSSTHGMTDNIALAYIPGAAPSGHNAYIENATGGAGDDYIYGNAVDNVLSGNAGDDFLYGYGGNDTLQGGHGENNLFGGSGHDDLIGSIDRDTLFGDDGNDTLHGWGDVDNLFGGNGTDNLFGGAHVDYLYGGNDADTLHGDWGADSLFGGDGDDTLYGDEGDDTLNGGRGINYFDGGDGEDTVDFSFSNVSRTIHLSEYADNTDGVHGAAHTNGVVEELVNIENVVAGNGNDIITGSNSVNDLHGGGGVDWLLGLDGDDNLYGGSGNDTLIGGAGGDDLFGGAGDDDFYGGDGDDLYIGAGGWDTIHFTGSTKDWTINLSFGSATNTQDSHLVGGNLVPDYVEVLSSIEEVQAGSGDDKLYGDGNVNALYGNDGDDSLFGYGSHDILNGGNGNDHLDGGDGNDILGGESGFDTASYHYATGGVRVDLAIAGPQDTVAAGFDTLNEIENLEGSFHDDFLFGDATNNWLEGGAGDDVLTGREGADWLWGEHGDDILLGGEGLDLLYGGDGSDTAAYTFASSSVQVDLSDTGFQETNGAGLDLLNGIENLAGSIYGDFLTGDDAGNTIDGFLGDDLINGLDGGDVINGGFGNDLLIGGLGNDVLDGGAGGDWALYHVGSTSGVVVDLTLGAQNTVGAGVDTLIDIENLRGSDFGDWLAGDDLSNEILGGGGGDRIFGRSGFDQIDGAQGNDFLFGNQGNDTLTGGAGNDTHWGGLGDDTFIFDINWGNDSIQDFEAGSDVLDFSAVTGVDGFHNLTYTETADGLEIGFDGNSVTLANIALIDLTGGDFIL